jgi:transcriptional regulator with GAF, ATPase, and Fis domain
VRARALGVRAAGALRDSQPAAAGRFAEEAIAVVNRCDPVLLRARLYESIATLLEETEMQRFLRKPTGPASAALLEVARDAWTSYGNEAMLRRIDLHLSELPRTASDPLAGPDAERLVKILHITREMNREFDRDALLGLILDRAIELTGAERGFVVLLNEGKEEVHLARNIDREAVSEPERKVSSQIIRDVIRTGRIVRSENAESDERFEESFSVRQLRLKSIIAVPFRSRGRTIGLLYLDNRFRVAHFDDTEERLLELFADQAVAAIEKAALIRELEGKRREVERLYGEQERRIEAQREALDRADDEIARHRRDRGWDLDRVVARSVRMQGVLRDARRFAETTLPVLLVGESGTGKGLLARSMHFAGPRAANPFLSLRGAGLGEARLEAELFGHVREGVGGEDRDRAGLLEQAEGGTLLIEDVDELPASIQARLAGVLDTGKVCRVGENRPRAVDVRLMTTSARDLRELIHDGRFREDLYLKVAGVVLQLPPLRDRREDIELLAVRFLEEVTRDVEAGPQRFSGEALARLESFPWPGNVRELRTVVLRAAALCEGEEIEIEHVQTDARALASLPGLDPGLADRTLEELTRRGIVLNRRQQNALLLALTHGKLEFGEYRRRFSVSKSTTARDLDQLLAEELLEKRGKTRAVVYLPGARLKDAARRVGAI